jgi:dihydrodipicolinate synthase/N-acetylneuraminate lyase
MFESFAQNLELLRAAEAAGCDFAFIDVPRGWRPADEDALFDGLRRLCDSTALGVFLHPVPHDNLRHLHPAGYSPRLFSRLATIENVVAAEITDFGLLAGFLDAVGDALVLQCPIERLLPLLAGRCGVTLLGPGAYELYQSPDQPLLVQCMDLLRAGDFAGAMDIHWRLTPARMAFEMKMFQMMPSGTHPLPLWKYYQWLAGGNGGYSPSRLPIMEVSQMDRMMARQARAMTGLSQPTPDDTGFYAGRVNSPPQPDLPAGPPPASPPGEPPRP